MHLTELTYCICVHKSATKEERRGDVENTSYEFSNNIRVKRTFGHIINSPSNYVDCLIDIANIACTLSPVGVYHLRD